MTSNEVTAILKNHVPESAVMYSLQLWEKNPFSLKLTKGRQTKVGDFTCKREGQHPRITLNHDLNPYLFLLTYIHEVAHWYAYKKYSHRIEPHGDQWKNTFRELLKPLLNETIFPFDILAVLDEHMKNPKASSFADTALTQTLRAYDVNYHHQLVLVNLPEGSIFNLNGRYFKKGQIRRTRILCREVKSKKQYLVPADALVTDVQLSIL